MKKISFTFLAAILGSFLFFSCGSKEKITSTVSNKHITVQQTTLGVKILLKKTAAEDINRIDVVDFESGSYASADFGTKTEASFYWPYADKNNTYTLIAKLYGNQAYDEETVTFTVENDCTSIISYTDDYINAKLNLIADGNKRLVKIHANENGLTTAIKDAPVENAIFAVEIFSGSKRKENDAVSAATIKRNISGNELKKLIDGYDIIGNASDFDMTAADMNKLLCKATTYFAKASIQFTLKDSSDITFGTKLIYSNDTIYTPLSNDTKGTESTKNTSEVSVPSVDTPDEPDTNSSKTPDPLAK